MNEIPLTQGQVALVDSIDFEWLNRWKWFAHRSKSGRVYAARWESGKMLFMHHAVLIHSGEIDHKEGCGLDNRRANLRPASHSQNIANSRMRSDNTSGFRGVGWDKQMRQWRAKITQAGMQKFLGLFHSREDAAQAYNAAAKKAFGEFARLNRI